MKNNELHATLERTAWKEILQGQWHLGNVHRNGGGYWGLTTWPRGHGDSVWNLGGKMRVGQFRDLLSQMTGQFCDERECGGDGGGGGGGEL